MTISAMIPKFSFTEPRSYIVSRASVIAILTAIFLCVLYANINRYESQPLQIHIGSRTDGYYVKYPSILIGIPQSANDTELSCVKEYYHYHIMDGKSIQGSANLDLKINPKNSVGDSLDIPPSIYAPYRIPPSENFTYYQLDSVAPTDHRNHTTHVQCSLKQTNLNANSSVMALVSIATSAPYYEEELEFMYDLDYHNPLNVFPLMANQDVYSVLGSSMFCDSSKICVYQYSRSMSQVYQMRNVAAGENISMFTIQLSDTHYEGNTMEVKELQFAYGKLEVASSMISLFNLSLVLYFILMGARKVQTLGWVQRYFLRKDTDEYIARIQEEGGMNDVSCLKKVLYGIYLNDSGISSQTRMKNSDDNDGGGGSP